MSEEEKEEENNIEDERQLEIFTERRMRAILKIKDSKIQIAKFNQMLSFADKELKKGKLQNFGCEMY